MKKVKLADCPCGSKVRLTPNTVLLTVQFHIHGQTRLLTGNGTEGGWRDSKDYVYGLLVRRLPFRQRCTGKQGYADQNLQSWNT